MLKPLRIELGRHKDAYQDKICILCEEKDKCWAILIFDLEGQSHVYFQCLIMWGGGVHVKINFQWPVVREIS